jgi:hypothetical protein
MIVQKKMTHILWPADFPRSLCNIINDPYFAYIKTTYKLQKTLFIIFIFLSMMQNKRINKQKY